MKSIFKLKPDDVLAKGATFDKYKKFLTTGVREMGKTNNSPDKAVWFFLDLKHAFPGDTPEDQKLGNLLFVLENDTKWKKHFNSSVSELKRILWGTCFVETSAEGSPLALVLQAAKGKAKDKDVRKRFRALTKKMGITLRISRGPEAQEDADPNDKEDGQAEELENLQSDLKELYSDLGKLAKPLSAKQLPQGEELQKGIDQFLEKVKALTDAKTRQQFAGFAQQVTGWQKALQEAVAKAKTKAQANVVEVTGAFPELWKKIDNIYKNDLKTGAALANDAKNAVVLKAMELRQYAQQLEKEYLKLSPQKQASVKKQMSSTRDWVGSCMSFLRQQGSTKLQQASAAAKAKASALAEKMKTGIMALTKKLNLNDGLQFEETAAAQQLQKGIEDFRITLQNASKEAQALQQSFFEQVKKLRNKLTLELGKVKEKAKADMPKLIEKQQADLAKAEALAKELDIFNMKA